jgi:hypothetical protein
MRRSHFLMFSSLLSGLLFALPVLAENSVRSGELVVHYNAVPTTSLTADVARQYGITRSANRALVNVSVRRGAPGADQAVPATVRVAATNLNGQRSDLRVREVREGEAIYYLAEPRIGARDTLDFELRITPQGSAAPVLVRFRQEFFPVAP